MVIYLLITVAERDLLKQFLINSQFECYLHSQREISIFKFFFTYLYLNICVNVTYFLTTRFNTSEKKVLITWWRYNMNSVHLNATLAYSKQKMTIFPSTFYCYHYFLYHLRFLQIRRTL